MIDHAIEIDFGSGGIGGNPNTTAADGYYEVDIKLPGQRPDRGAPLLPAAGRRQRRRDGGRERLERRSPPASTRPSQMGWTPLNADVTGAGTVTAFDLTLATRSKGRKLGAGLALG